VREKSLRSASQPALAFYRLDLTENPWLHNTFTLSPYPAIFCRQNARPFGLNCSKTNTLLKPSQSSSSKSAA